MAGFIGRLQGVGEMVEADMIYQLLADDLFQDFAQKRKVGYWPIVLKIVFVLRWLLQDWGNHTNPQ